MKAVDDNKADINYKNSDHAGTPENFLKYVIGGARGGGGNNFTGKYSESGQNARAGKLTPARFARVLRQK